ncbi:MULTISPECIES: hypothetical protein [unclassified Nocardia]|uniref:hypothetical protein n=1 Tax=unclassified Nocardia TaxID=2637762 RepID=UPI001CE474AA|nr:MULTISPECIES: hypothetical protein [unclassified Nocardia]
MALEFAGDYMTSDLTPERADRLTDQWARAWRLSWLPDRLLTEQQARAGLELAEIIHGTPDFELDELRLARAARCAGLLRLVLQQAVIVLNQRRSP